MITRADIILFMIDFKFKKQFSISIILFRHRINQKISRYYKFFTFFKKLFDQRLVLLEWTPLISSKKTWL